MRALSALLNRVGYATDAFDLDFDDIAGDQRPDASRRSGRNEVPWLQCHDARDVGEEGWDREDHLAAVPPLSLDAVHPGDDGEIVEVRKL